MKMKGDWGRQAEDNRQQKKGGTRYKSKKIVTVTALPDYIETNQREEMERNTVERKEELLSLIQ